MSEFDVDCRMVGAGLAGLEATRHLKRADRWTQVVELFRKS